MKTDDEFNALNALEEIRNKQLFNGIPQIKDVAMSNVQLNANSAFDFAKQQEKVNKSLQEVAEYNARKDAVLFQTARESITQTEILKKQLQTANERNDILLKNYSELEKINTQLKEESEANKLASKKARRLNIAAFILSIVLPLASIGASILIALFL